MMGSAAPGPRTPRSEGVTRGGTHSEDPVDAHSSRIQVTPWDPATLHGRPQSRSYQRKGL